MFEWLPKQFRMLNKLHKIIMVLLLVLTALALYKGGEALVVLLGALAFGVTPKVISNAQKLENRSEEKARFEEQVTRSDANSDSRKEVGIQNKAKEIDEWLDR